MLMVSLATDRRRRPGPTWRSPCAAAGHFVTCCNTEPARARTRRWRARRLPWPGLRGWAARPKRQRWKLLVSYNASSRVLKARHAGQQRTPGRTTHFGHLCGSKFSAACLSYREQRPQQCITRASRGTPRHKIKMDATTQQPTDSSPPPPPPPKKRTAAQHCRSIALLSLSPRNRRRRRRRGHHGPPYQRPQNHRGSFTRQSLWTCIAFHQQAPGHAEGLQPQTTVQSPAARRGPRDLLRAHAI